MKIFKELTKNKSDKNATAQLEANGDWWLPWTVTLTLFVDGRKIASTEKIIMSNEWRVHLAHSGFTVHAQREVRVLEESQIHFYLE
jgi:hypothetical protein